MKTNVKALLAIFLLFVLVGCKKKAPETSTIIFLGPENYVSSIDDVYPKKYRDEMKSIMDSLKLVDSTFVVDPTYYTISDGYCPPDVQGNFYVDAVLLYGNERIVLLPNDTSSYTDIPPYHYDYYNDNNNKEQMKFGIRVESQHNAKARVEFSQYDQEGNMKFDTIIDDAFVCGSKQDSVRGNFTIYFSTVEKETIINGTGEETNGYAYLFMGTIYRNHGHGQDTPTGHGSDGIENVRVWKLYKSYISPNHANVVGGQRVYNDKDSFSPIVNSSN